MRAIVEWSVLLCHTSSLTPIATTRSSLLMDNAYYLKKALLSDPLAMAMYAVGTQPLIHRLDGIAKQVWYADDSAAGSRLERLRRWWDLLVEVSPLYGYFPNGSKTHVLAKSNHVEAAKEIFKGTGVVISTEGERYLGGAVGKSSFVRQNVKRKVEGWVNEVKKLSKIAETQPHAAYAAYTHGLSSKWNYLLRITDCEENQLNDIVESLEKAITLYPSTHWATSSRRTYTRAASITRKTWWSGPDESRCLSKRPASCLTADQCPTCRPNHQPGPPVR